MYLHWVIHNFYRVLTGDYEFKKRGIRGVPVPERNDGFQSKHLQGFKLTFCTGKPFPQMPLSSPSLCDDPGAINKDSKTQGNVAKPQLPLWKMTSQSFCISHSISLKYGSCHCPPNASTVGSSKCDQVKPFVENQKRGNKLTIASFFLFVLRSQSQRGTRSRDNLPARFLGPCQGGATGQVLAGTQLPNLGFSKLPVVGWEPGRPVGPGIHFLPVPRHCLQTVSTLFFEECLLFVVNNQSLLTSKFCMVRKIQFLTLFCQVLHVETSRTTVLGRLSLPSS